MAVHNLEPYRFFEIIDDLLKKISSVETVNDLYNALKTPVSIIGKYCIMDSILCLQLSRELQVIKACEEMANCTNITLEDVLCRGNQYRVFNVLYKKCQKYNIVVNKPEGAFETMNNSIRGNLSGALVLEPVVGLHKGVVVVDFASLYPSIIINYNLCYTTICLKKNENTREIITREGVYYFDKKRKGILPQIEEELIKTRKTVKEELSELKKKEKETGQKNFRCQVLDARQLALKITANSIYGALGADNGKRVLAPVASCITGIGRDLLTQVREMVKNRGYKVVYGDTDSLMIKLPSNIMNDTKTFLSYFCDDLKKANIEYSLSGSGEYLKIHDEEKEREVAKEYNIVITDTGINVPLVLKTRAEFLGKELAAWITNMLNSKTGLESFSFNLEFENCFEVYLLIGKKYYAGRLFGERKIIKKGVLSVKRIYAPVEKNIYDTTLSNIFDNEDVIEKIADCFQKIFTTPTKMYDYVITSSFKSINSYADQVVKGVLYIDENGERFVDAKKNDPRLHFSRLPPNAMVAVKMYNRSDPVPNNSRIEYLFYQVYIGSNACKTTKGDKIDDFQYIYRNRKFFKVDKLEYLKRVVDPIDKILNTAGIKLKDVVTVEETHVILSKYFSTKSEIFNLPDLLDIITIRETTKKLSRSETQLILSNSNVQYTDLSHPEVLRTKISGYSVTISRAVIERYEKRLAKEVKRAIKKDVNVPDEIREMCAVFQSRFVLNSLYKKYNVRVSRKKRTICGDIFDCYAQKLKVIAELNERFSIFV